MSNRRQFIVTAGALGLSACAGVPGADGRTLKLVTFNIWHNQGDWEARRPLLIEAIRTENADVIALQEVLQDLPGLPLQAQTIADGLGGGYRVFFSSVDGEDKPRRYGNAILTRLPVIEHDWVALRPVDDYRTALRVRVDMSGRSVDICNTHLAYQPEAGAVRTEQIAHMLEWLPDDGTPLIVMGDLNAQMTTPEISNLRGARFTEVFSALHPDRAMETTMNLGYYPGEGMHIDHVLVEKAHFEPVSSDIIGQDATGGEWPSDHFGVSATVRLV